MPDVFCRNIAFSYRGFVLNSEHLQCYTQRGRKKSHVTKSSGRLVRRLSICFTETHSDARKDEVFIHLTSTDFPILRHE